MMILNVPFFPFGGVMWSFPGRGANQLLTSSGEVPSLQVSTTPRPNPGRLSGKSITMKGTSASPAGQRLGGLKGWARKNKWQIGGLGFESGAPKEPIPFMFGDPIGIPNYQTPQTTN